MPYHANWGQQLEAGDGLALLAWLWFLDYLQNIGIWHPVFISRYGGQKVASHPTLVRDATHLSSTCQAVT